jgi:diguanylate cyclase (GGDEF)-like protein
MKLAAALIYWVIVAVWFAVLATVVVFYFRKGRTFGATRMLLAVVAIDTVRNIAENIYFGLYFDAQYGFLPSALIGLLGQPIFLIIPKILNIASGGLVMSILLLRWLPQAVNERKLLQLDADLQRKLATIDSMTGLLNRRQFFVAAEVERERSRRYRRPLSMLMIDIDEFKSINDNFGHDVGDEVIVLVANVCQGLIRSTDLIARLGGEEFALLLPETGLKDAGDLAERLREAVSKIDLAEAGGAFTPTISIGVCEAPDGTPISDLLKWADVALYDAKQAGRNRVSLFDPARVRPIAARSSTLVGESIQADVRRPAANA